MKISDLINITGGTLINEPQIQRIEGATVFPSKVELGDLFLASKKEDIQTAVESGAYAIIFEGDMPRLFDSDIAWINVTSVKEASFKLLRYVLLQKEAEFYLLKPHELSFLKMVLARKSAISILPSDWIRAFEMILNGDGKLFVGDSSELLETIIPEPKSLESISDGYLISDTLFRSTFKVDGYIYQNRELAPFHLEHILRVNAFAKDMGLEIDLEKIRYTKHFQPLFIDANLRVVPKGSSDRALIFVDNIKDIIEAREYIKNNGKWIKSIVLTPPKTKIEGVERPLWFNTPKKARDILKSNHFNYAFIYSLSRDFLDEIKQEKTLF